jgi:hypothetical protein
MPERDESPFLNRGGRKLTTEGVWRDALSSDYDMAGFLSRTTPSCRRASDEDGAAVEPIVTTIFPDRFDKNVSNALV